MQANQNLIPLTTGARSVIRALQSVGRPLIVGGAVRDALLEPRHDRSRAIDIDIEVHGSIGPDATIDALSDIGPAKLQGKAFGIITLSIGQEMFDISVAPSNEPIETDRALNRAAFARRDFTINAIGWDPVDGSIIDPSDGISDIRLRRLDPVGDSFPDDPLRVLRGIQLIARFDLTPSADFISRSRALVNRYGDLPTERVWGEWRKLARLGRSIGAALNTLDRTSWLRCFPELAALSGTRQDPSWHPEGDVYVHAGLAAEAAASMADRDELTPEQRELHVFAALIHDMGKPDHTQVRGDGRITSYGHADGGVAPARAFLSQIGAPRHLVDELVPLVREHMAYASVTGNPSVTAVRRLMRRLKPATIRDWGRLLDADASGRGSGAKVSQSAQWLTVAERIGAAPAPGLLSGRDLIDAGLRPGPEFGAILARALEAQDAGEFETTEQAIAWLNVQPLSPLDTAEG